MATVLIVNTALEEDGLQRHHSTHKAYHLPTQEAAEKFAEKIDGYNQSVNEFCYFSTHVVAETVDVSVDDEILVLSVFSCHKEDNGELILDYYDSKILTEREIEKYRTEGANPSIVKAFDNFSELNEAELSEDELETTGYYHLGSAEDDIVFMTFSEKSRDDFMLEMTGSNKTVKDLS